MSIFRLAVANVKSTWDKSQHVAPPRTITPLPDLSQGSMIEINSVPLILAQSNGSLIGDYSNRNLVPRIGKLSYMGLDFFRIYLSNDDDTFLHLAVKQSAPKQILECRLYKTYLEYLPGDDKNAWDVWLKDDPDPQYGGMIGCPNLQGKPDDGPPTYIRSWMLNDKRIQPIYVQEVVLDSEGHVVNIRHRMMHYGRTLKDDKQMEYMAISVVEAIGVEASVCMWVGIDVDLGHVTIYPGA